MRDWQKDLSDSAYDFRRVVWPAVEELLGGGELVPVEAVTRTDFAKHLDQLSGIDAWQMFDGQGMRGIASRVQWGKKAWDTFTVRMSRRSGVATEYEKRKAAIGGERGLIYPHLTIHAYVAVARTGDLIRAGVVQTEDLITAITAGKGITRHSYDGGATFKAVPFSAIRDVGWPIIVVDGPAAKIP